MPVTAGFVTQKAFSVEPSKGEDTVAISQTSNPCGNLEHLMDGYDDQQQASIQKEMARSIKEQNKMFAARKVFFVISEHEEAFFLSLVNTTHR